MTSVDTTPELMQTINEGLQYWQNLLPHQSRLSATLPTIYYEQEEIGWNQFLEGFHHANWQELQQQHYTQIRPFRTGCHWQIGIIKQLWELAKEL
jgi:hypothetical protein